MATNNSTNTEIIPGGAETYTFPAASDTLVGRNSTDVLTNKTIDASANTLIGVPSITTKQLTSDQSNSTVTGTKLAGLDTALTAGTYSIKYVIRYQAGATTTGVKFGINYTGTATSFTAYSLVSTAGTAAVSTIHDQTSTAIVIMGTTMTRALSTTAPNMGPSTGVGAANSDMLWTIESLLIVSNSGTLELWHASEVAAISTVKAGTSVIITKIS